MLTRIRNANTAMHDDISMPSSKLKELFADVLKSEGYIDSYSIDANSKGPGNTLSINMKYSSDRKRVISGITRVSTPGLRVYRKSTEVPRVLGGLGVAVLSTNRGLMTDREARRRRIGGEVLAYVW